MKPSVRLSALEAPRGGSLGQSFTATARTKRTSYSACSCCSSIVAGGSGSGGSILGGVGDRAHAQVELQLVVDI